jgi:hypothetical protein
VTVTWPLVATSGVEGRSQKSATGGAQEVEEYFTGGHIPSTPGISHECAIQPPSTGAGV